MQLMVELIALKIHKKTGTAVMLAQVIWYPQSSLIFAIDKPIEYKLILKVSHFSVDCKMGTWGSWESCGTSCRARDGTGVQTRTRSPNLYAANNGADCTESTSDNRACSVVCPGNV